MNRCDAIVIGAGHNGLNAEIYFVSEVMQRKVDARATVVDHRFYRPAHRNG